MHPGHPPAINNDARPYPSMQPLAADVHPPAGDAPSYSQQQPSYGQQPYLEAPQQQPPYQGVAQAAPYPQQWPYPTAGGLTEDLQNLNLQHTGSAAASTHSQQQQQQQLYSQPYQQQQQQPFSSEPQLQQPYPLQQAPYSQPQLQQPYPQEQLPYSQPQPALYPQPPQPATYPQQAAQQQHYPQQAPPYTHSGSGRSHQYGSFNSQQQQQQQQQQQPYGNSSSFGQQQQYGSGSSSHPYPCPYPPNSPAGQLQQHEQYDSSHSQQYGSSSQHCSSLGAGSSFSSEAYGPFGAADAPQQQPSRYPSVHESASCGSQQQQQQQQEALPPYPAVPQALPVMPYNVAPEKVSQGYDVMLYIQAAKDLPSCDWWNGRADPYVIITAHVGGEQFQYKTAHKRATVNPEFENEFFEIGNLPKNTTFFVEVWDKDVVTDDDVIGRSSWCFSPHEMLPASTAGGGLLSEDQSWGRLLVKLPLKHPSKATKKAGQIELEVCYRPSTHVAPPRMLGPVRFRQHLSPNAGLFTGHWWSEADMSFMTYKLFLTNIGAVFGGVRMPWNKNYDKAVAIFKNPVVLGGIRTQHSALYSTHRGDYNRGGMLTTAADFFETFHNGMRGGERRFFTYVLCEDSLRCSETGAAFFNDMFSKHAMHSGGQEEVLYAGEFCIVPCPGAAGGHKLVIDNNSGTYAPDKAKLPLMQKLFTLNFPDMTVEVLDMKDPRLLELQKSCPSRLSLAAQQPK